MDRRTINFIIVISLTACVGLLTMQASRVSRIENEKFFQFPLVVGDWIGKEQTLSQWAYNALETPYVFVRDYTNPRSIDTVNLSLVWFDDTNIAFHAPEACMSDRIRASHATRIIFDESGEQEVKKLLVELGGTKNVMLYFFDVNGYITTSQVCIRIKILYNRLHLKRSAATFIRVIAPIRGDDETRTIEELQLFLKEFMPVIREYMYIRNLRDNGI